MFSMDILSSALQEYLCFLKTFKVLFRNPLSHRCAFQESHMLPINITIPRGHFYEPPLPFFQGILPHHEFQRNPSLLSSFPTAFQAFSAGFLGVLLPSPSGLSRNFPCHFQDPSLPSTFFQKKTFPFCCLWIFHVFSKILDVFKRYTQMLS